MAGHSKFKNIQYRKGAQDKKRAKVFARLAKELTVAAKLGQSDPDANPRLRTAMMAARAQNMPKDNIERAIKRGDDGDGANYEEVRYEGFAAGGIGVIVETMTDNRNRTAAEIRTRFSKNGGNLGEVGSVSFMFDRLGAIEFAAAAGDAETVFTAALEAGADDVSSTQDGHEIICPMENLHIVVAALSDTLGEPISASIIWRAQNDIAVEGETAEKILKLIEALDDIDDVQNIYANFDMTEDFIEKFSA